MINKRLWGYRGFVDAFGWKYGIKVIFMRWVSHFTKEKKSYKILTNVGETYIRINSSDVDLARKLVGQKGGEYDFLKDITDIDSFKCIVDAGANIGLFSMLVQNVAPQARIIAIEANEDNYKMCLKNIQLNSNDVIIQAGLWSKPCKLEIKVRSTGDVGFVVYEDARGGIDAISMKEIIEQYNVNSIDLLKMDIEGSEYEVFEESVDEWIDMVRILIIEIHERIKSGCEKRVKTVMAKHNYSHQKYGEYDVFKRN